MKQNEDEWLEYHNVMEDVIKRSRLDKTLFFDLRGNHDNFGVPQLGGSFDFFSKYSISGQLGRRRNVNSVTLQVLFFSLSDFQTFSFSERCFISLRHRVFNNSTQLVCLVYPTLSSTLVVRSQFPCFDHRCYRSLKCLLIQKLFVISPTLRLLFPSRLVIGSISLLELIPQCLLVYEVQLISLGIQLINY